MNTHTVSTVIYTAKKKKYTDYSTILQEAKFFICRFYVHRKSHYFSRVLDLQKKKEGTVVYFLTV